MPTATASWEDWPLERKRTFLAELRQRRWRWLARPEQLPPDAWTTLLLRGGRGSGKTWAGAHIFAEEISSDPDRTEGEWAVVAPTFGDARDKCIESEESGLLMALGTSVREVEAGTSATVAKWNRSIGELELHDGTKVYIDGADDGAYRIQGYNLRGAWCDEVGLWKRWKDAWDESLGYALRKGRARRIATGTPKRNQPARKLVRRLLEDPNVVSRQLLTRDNLDNLSETFRQEIARHEGTELARQELAGELLEDAEGALWKREWIEQRRREGPPHGQWQAAPVVGADPADGTEDGAEHAYTVAGLGLDHGLYVVENEGLRTSPYSFACTVVRVASKHGARIVLEKNHGGAWLVEVFERAMRDLGIRVAVEVVHAAQGKRTRAEPVAGLYEQGHVHHVGVFEQLEDQFCNFTGAPNETSPDRLDSAVWALSRFTTRHFGPPPPEDGAVPYTTKPEAQGAVAWS